MPRDSDVYLDIIWDVVTNKLPDLERSVRRLLGPWSLFALLSNKPPSASAR